MRTPKSSLSPVDAGSSDSWSDTPPIAAPVCTVSGCGGEVIRVRPSGQAYCERCGAPWTFSKPRTPRP